MDRSRDFRFLGFGFAVAEENMRARCFREKRFAGWLAADVGRRGWLFYGVFPFEKNSNVDDEYG